MNVPAVLQAFPLAICLAAMGIACSIDVPASSPARPSALSQAHPGIPVIEMRRVSAEPAALVAEVHPSGWQVFPGSGGAVVSPRGDVVLQGTKRRPVVAVRPAPGDGDLLVNFGSGNYGIYDVRGKHIVDVPKIHDRFKDASVATWRWMDGDTLVGVSEISQPAVQPMYPDGDVLPESTTFLLFKPYLDAETVYVLDVPDPLLGEVVRLEGVTADGMLQLGSVSPNQYFGGPPSKILGVFEVGGHE
ncbi:hypothetical protein BGP89_14140 [Luteimonas sp. JM171]|uniref:hypothetical protein n=1 Tax=Luteimonas sp. JM171 TaxID=1896164 RepID=UPI0012F81DA5|nr:hypothetical protein [Luteimonas sp. JM171]